MSTASLTIDGLTVDFSGFRAVDSVSTVVDAGELRVLLGANGAGKTTLMDLISGKTRATAGKVYIGDTEVTAMSEHAIARAGMGRKFQIPSVFRDLTVRQNLEVAASPSPGVFANLRFALPSSTTARIDEIIELVGLGDRVDTDAGTLSHGETQWLELGMLIAQRPKVILLDEPTAGMTEAETMKTAAIIKAMRGEHTLVVVEHDMAFVKEIANRITVMHLGKVLAEGSVESIEKNQAVRDAYLGSKGIV
ncbi:urea ABC transporter ATP-binding protein UrtD [Aliihoeflea sp. 40Bstr573]|uniref:urea ABC transporter ATP-binding protein UrtD n=1 Tax=Aliihoeflea sp. 40Bstr573 TaxID=2696467 RepID=UPI00209631A4|nr:urea ABC transporter ATP-binding protein UrtD [Aliihoeflea sp. 40Bstr573]MCO6387784.1 urea ABC transporter ATP-binding protein UrtD [Aliihoeflea sp. 40Bstr573]